MIVKFPLEIKPDQKRNSDMLNFIDFAPTVLSIAGLEIPKIFQGLAFLGSKKNPKIKENIYLRLVIDLTSIQTKLEQ